MAPLNIKETEFFSGFTESDFDEVMPYFANISLNKKEMIFSEGENSGWLYIVTEGKVKITKLSHDGKEIILELIQPGELFGAVAVFKGIPYPANAIAMERSKVLRISRKGLLKLLDRFPHLMLTLTSIIGERIKNSYETLKNIALERVESRVAALLLKLADKTCGEEGKGTHIDMKLTKQDIADMVGTTVETSIRTISKFKKEGLITESDGKIIILDRANFELYNL
ncbi:MAG: Crp/Fnr family transcriptional regulator [Nitrospirae bacterium]|nr:Crp/Fnr family transcriptional regulator [Nitrospirota bacterium]